MAVAAAASSSPRFRVFIAPASWTAVSQSPITV
jgi:hypothetical protein